MPIRKVVKPQNSNETRLVKTSFKDFEWWFGFGIKLLP
jgi:hypothetical protein